MNLDLTTYMLQPGREMQDARVLDAMGNPFNIPGLSSSPVPIIDRMHYVHELDPGGFTGSRFTHENQQAVSIDGNTNIEFFDDAANEIPNNIFIAHALVSLTAAAGVSVHLRMNDDASGVFLLWSSNPTTIANQQVYLPPFLIPVQKWMQVRFTGGGAGETAGTFLSGYITGPSARTISYGGMPSDGLT